MIFPVTPETHALLCLLIIAVAFIAAMVISELPAPTHTVSRRRQARRTHHRRKTHLRVIHTQRAARI